MGKTVFLRRPNIDRELQLIFEKPLYIVNAPSGFGKTVAVSSFLNRQKAKTIWVACDLNDSPQMTWQKFTDQIAVYNKNLAVQLRQLGLPNDLYQQGRIVELLMDFSPNDLVVFVFDDYQNVESNEFSTIISAIAEERISNTHIVIITRDMTYLDSWSYYNRDLCHLMTGNSLKFSPYEIRSYAKLLKIDLSETEAKNIYNYSQGWISLIYLTLCNLKQGMDISNSISVDELFDRTIFGTLSEKDKLIWLKLSLLEDFTIPMALYVLNDKSLVNLPNQIFKDNALLNYNSFTKSYSIHSLYSNFLRERAMALNVDLKEVYSRAGHWWLKNDNFMAACDYLSKSGEVEIILEEMNKEDMPDIKFVQFHQISQIFEGVIDKGLWEKYPLAFLQYLRTQLVSGNFRAKQKCGRLLKTMENYFTEADLDTQYRNFILGEINIVWPFVVFNDCEKMIEYNKKAEYYLNGNCSCIVTRKKEVTFGSPHFLYIYYREQGKLKETTDLIVNNFFRFALVADGCGTGCDSLAQAEYNLETGDFDNVELYAYKAMFKAKAADQLGTVVCAGFAMLRYTIYKANFSESKKIFDSLRHAFESENNPVLLTAFDMCNAYINCCLKNINGLPKWIKEGNFDSGSFMFEGVAFNYVVYEKCLLLMGEYMKLDAMCELFPNYNFHYNNQLGVLHNCIHEAIAKGRILGDKYGKEKLIESLNMGEADNIVLPFAENEEYILGMLYSIAESKSFPNLEYLEKIIRHTETYASSTKQLETNREILTPREKEIMILLANGFKYSDIAMKLSISTTTVRFHIRNIYNKLEVNNKVAMLHKARELNLIT